MVALEHTVEPAHLLLELADAARVADDDADEGGDVEPEPAGVEERPIARDDARGLELLDALEDGRRREPHHLADARERDAAVLLQHGEDAEIRVVQLARCAVAESHKAGLSFCRTYRQACFAVSTVY